MSLDDPYGNARNLITRNQIFLRHPTQFNDPFDTVNRPRGLGFRQPSIEVGELKINLGFMDIDINGGIMAWAHSYRAAQMASAVPVYVFCLSEYNDSILMWSHYADKHAGVCVGVEFENDIIGDAKLIKVSYGNKRSTLPEYLTLGQPDTDEKFLEILEALVETAVAVKSEAWEYEQEHRIVLTPKKLLDLHERSISIAPHGRVVEVIGGVRVTESNVRAVNEWIEDSGRASEIRYRSAYPSSHDYSLQFVQPGVSEPGSFHCEVGFPDAAGWS